jgi:hypothetical protein
MGKTSTNAGIHPYLKPDFISPLKFPEKKGKPFAKTVKFMDVLISTEYKDSKNHELYFKDEVEFEGKQYEITYDAQNFCWILKREQKTVALKNVYKKVVLTKKCPARLAHAQQLA